MRHPLPTVALALALPLAACVGPPTPVIDPAVPVQPDPSPERLPVPERVGFVVRRGADTVAVERTSRTRVLLTADLDARGQARVEYQASLGPTRTVTRLLVGVAPASAPPAAAPTQRTTLEFRGDTVVALTVVGDSTRTDRIVSRDGAIPYINPSMGLTEQIVLRARLVGGTQVEVPVFVASGGQTIPATVTFAGRDSAQLTLAGVTMRLAVDADGRLLGGTVPAQGLTIERTGELPATP